MTEQSKYRTYAVVLLAGLVTFLYQMADVIGKIQSWEVMWNPPEVSQMMTAIAAALVAMGAAIGLDLPSMVRGLFKPKV